MSDENENIVISVAKDKVLKRLVARRARLLQQAYQVEIEIEKRRGRYFDALPISFLELSTRTANCLANLGVVTVTDIVTLSRKSLRRTPNFGDKSLAELEEALHSCGLKLLP